MYRPFLPEAIGVRGMPPAVRPGCPGGEGPAIATAIIVTMATVKKRPAARATFRSFANGEDGWIEPTGLVHPFSCRCSSSIHPSTKASIQFLIHSQPLLILQSQNTENIRASLYYYGCSHLGIQHLCFFFFRFCT